MYCLDPYIMLDNKIYLNLQYGYSFNLTFNSCLWKWVWRHNKQTITFLVNILKTHNRDLSERYAPEGSFKLIFIYTAQFHKSQFAPRGFCSNDSWQQTIELYVLTSDILSMSSLKSFATSPSQVSRICLKSSWVKFQVKTHAFHFSESWPLKWHRIFLHHAYLPNKYEAI